MPEPTVIDIPHALGREEARRRLRTRIGDVARHVPGGVADVTSSWPGEDRMALTVTAMGQTISGTIDVQDRLLRVSLALPMMLSFIAPMITSAIKREGGALLLGDQRDG